MSRRRSTRTVTIGALKLGSDYPIRVQSMTTADTCDTEKTVTEIERLVLAGCELVRLTVPTKADADNLPSIRAEMKRRRLDIPVVADIHFTPSVAMMVVEHVEKIRINPGNFADKKRFKVVEMTDAEYNAELERIYEKFSPLVLKCKDYGRAMRIGVNHGSLSDRIMNRYGDTTHGMVESALEFARICQDLGFYNLVFSMKASNPMIMIAAYRLLAERLDALGMSYPFHLGVTEAGNGEDGRIKSAIGIGSLLEDGIGDTIRVSLTEDPEHEVPVAFDLVEKFLPNPPHSPFAKGGNTEFATPQDSHAYSRRPSTALPLGEIFVGASSPIRVIGTLSLSSTTTDTLSAAQSLLNTADDGIPAAEGLHTTVRTLADLERVQTLQQKLSSIPSAWVLTSCGNIDLAIQALPHASAITYAPTALQDKAHLASHLSQLQEACRHNSVIPLWDLTALARAYFGVYPEDDSETQATAWGEILDAAFPGMVTLGHGATIVAYRRLAALLATRECRYPIHLRFDSSNGYRNSLIGYAAQLGSLLCDGIGDSIEIAAPDAPAKSSLSLAYNILQAAGLRIFKADFVSCPSCGRTQFDLQTTTARIKDKFGHLKGVKIAIMGCIVNGPGEMADAHFGYVGAGSKKIDLYVGKDCVTRGIDESMADEKLKELIASHGAWVDPS